MLRVEDKSWPSLAYIVITSGICILAGSGIFLYLRHRQNKKILNLETPNCCARLAILCSDGSKVDKNEPRDQLTMVSYSKETDEATIQRLYPSLSGVAK